MIPRVQINPNLRVTDSLTMADLYEDVDGGVLVIGGDVVVYEPVSGLNGRGQVTAVKLDGTVYLKVDWGTLTLRAPSSGSLLKE